MRLRPAPRLAWLALVPVIPAAFAGNSSLFLALFVVLNAVWMVLAVIDARVGSRNDVIVRRVSPPRTSRLRPFTLRYEVENESDLAVTVDFVDRLPPAFEPRELRFSLVVPPGKVEAVQHTMRVVRRGQYPLRTPLVVRLSPLCLFRIGVPCSAAGSLSVIPDTSALGRFDALVRQQKLHEMGIASARVRGEGTEISGLRPYAQGDPFTRIDWKATARRGVPVTREMHAERRQNLLLLLDCGRRMAREEDGRSHLDRAIEASLLLSHVALRTDDRVGLVAFADRVLGVVAPVRGLAGAPALAEAVYDVEPILKEPPYEAIASKIATLFPRRSMCVLFTDATEPSSLDSLLAPVRFLSKRHLLLCVVFRDPSVEAALRGAPKDALALYRAGAASGLALERERGLRRLRDAGSLVLEAESSKLSSAVVNRYLEAKARNLL